MVVIIIAAVLSVAMAAAEIAAERHLHMEWRKGLELMHRRQRKIFDASRSPF